MTNSNYGFYDYHYMSHGVGDKPRDELYLKYIELIYNTNYSKILEIGCGSGNLTKHLLEHELNVVSIDIDKSSKKYLYKNCSKIKKGKLKFYGVNFLQFSNRETYKFVLASDDFLRHILSFEELNDFFKKLKDILIVGGRFITDLRITRDDNGLIGIHEYPLTKLKRAYNSIKFIKPFFTHKELVSANLLKHYFEYNEYDNSMKLVRKVNKTLLLNNFTISQIEGIAKSNEFDVSIIEHSLIGHIFLTFIKK